MTIPRNAAGMPVRPLGRTGIDVSIIGFGGGHSCRPTVSEAETIRLIQAAVDGGITFFDNAWEYWGGESEKRFGKALEHRRDEVVLMTKVCARDKAGALDNLHDSLRRLRTDVIDVWQFHEVVYDNDPLWISRAGGALEAAIEAKEAGKVRAVGFTGHKLPSILRAMLDIDFPWDTCQLPVNVADAHYRSFQNDLLPELVTRGIGPLGMKSLGGDAQLITEAGLTAEECRRYALTLPISTLICGMQSEENLQQDLAIGRNFEPYTDEEMQTLRDRVAPISTDGRHEWFKSTQYYDSALHRKQHGFPPIGHVGETQQRVAEAQGDSP